MAKSCRFCKVEGDFYECPSCHRIYTFLLNLYKYTDSELDRKVAEYKEKLTMIEVTKSNKDMKEKVLYVRSHNSSNNS